MTSVLSLSGLNVAFGSHHVVRDVDLAVAPGETVGLLGPNGAGKSTVLHSIVGLVAPHTGTISVCGVTADSRAAKTAIGFAPDDLPTPLSLTGSETLALVARLRGAVFDSELGHWLADRLQLTPHLSRAVGGYSHGMRRRLQLVCAISHRPRLLILDEPLRGLDPEASAILHALIEVQVGAAGGVLLATHDLDGAARYCDRIVVMAQGEVIATGSAAEIQLQAGGAVTLADAFLTLSGMADRVRQERSDILRRLGPPQRERAVSC